MIVEFLLSNSNTGISKTFPVLGQIGKKGLYVFCLSFPSVGKIIFIIPS